MRISDAKTTEKWTISAKVEKGGPCRIIQTGY